MYRMSKSRTSDSQLLRTASNAEHSSDSESSTHLPIRACFDDLKRPENRQLLRQQLTGTFPETASPLPRRPSNEVLIEKWSLKDRLSKKTLRLEVTDLDPHSSTSTVDSVGLRRLSAVPEKNNDESIDIEKAISLLQELKKIASPSELVALHRALLPTKETEKVKSPSISPLHERTSPLPAERKRSVLPPGLATRGGATEDVLRKPSGTQKAVPVPTPAKQDDWCTHRPAGSLSSLAALDLADDGANPVTTRPVTPSDFAYAHTGAYQHGTLRVTNGAASPVPSLRQAPAVDAVRENLRTDYQPALQSRATIDVMSANGSKDLRAVRNRLANLEKTGRYEKRPVHNVLEKATSIMRHPALRPMSKASTGSIDTTNNDHENNLLVQRNSTQIASSVSPVDTADYFTHDAPAVDRRTRPGSAVGSNLADDSDSHESNDQARDVALARLNGSMHRVAPASLSARNSEEHFWLNNKSRLDKTHRFDSGYSSDISSQTAQSRISQNGHSSWAATAPVAKSDQTTDQDTLQVPEMAPHSTADLTHDQRPSLSAESSQADLPAQEARYNQDSSLEFNTDALTQNTHEEADYASPMMPTDVNVAVPITLREKLNNKSQKKLQKNMPPSVKYRRKLESERIKQAKLAEQFKRPVTRPEVPLSAEDLQKAAELLGDCEYPMTDSAVMKQDDASQAHSRRQSRDVKELSQQTMPTADDSPKTETSWRSRLRNRSQNRSKSQNHLETTDESETMQTARDSISCPTREEVRLLIGSSIHTDLYPVPVTAEQSKSLASRTEDSRISASCSVSTEEHARVHSRPSSDRVKAKSMSGMSETVASEFARARSRDRMVPTYDRPRTVTPTRGGLKTRSSAASAEDIFPGWHSKNDERSLLPANRNSLYAESIPPLPELPADVEVKAHKADGILAKRLKNSPRTSLITAAPTSLIGSAHSSDEDHESTWPETVRTQEADEIVPERPENISRSSWITATHTSLIGSAHSSDEDHESTWPEAAKAAVTESMVMPSQHSSQEFSVAPSTSTTSEDWTKQIFDENAGTTPRQSITSSGDGLDLSTPSPKPQATSGWETQAKIWRQRRLSIGATLGKVVPEDDEKAPIVRQASVKSFTKSSSPAIVVTRYVTPLSQDSQNRQNVGRHIRDKASVHADSYIELIGDENRPSKEDIPRTISTIPSEGSFATKCDMPLMKHDRSRRNYTVASNPFQRTPSGRVRTESGSWHPYRPQHASEAERSRAQSLAQLTGEANNNNNNNNTTNNTRQSANYNVPSSESPSKSTDSLVDRFSGGLAYNWNRGSGFNGSAGTHISGSELTHRKSMPMSEAFGLDLSDVPVILRKVL